MQSAVLKPAAHAKIVRDRGLITSKKVTRVFTMCCCAAPLTVLQFQWRRFVVKSGSVRSSHRTVSPSNCFRLHPIRQWFSNVQQSPFL